MVWDSVVVYLQWRIDQNRWQTPCHSAPAVASTGAEILSLFSPLRAIWSQSDCTLISRAESEQVPLVLHQTAHPQTAHNLFTVCLKRIVDKSGMSLLTSPLLGLVVVAISCIKLFDSIASKHWWYLQKTTFGKNVKRKWKCKTHSCVYLIMIFLPESQSLSALSITPPLRRLNIMSFHCIFILHFSAFVFVMNYV